ncbi:MAG: hypothetical protein QXT45_08205 [Candidatus Bilamarchaeaceae archaeon]
MKIHLIGTRTEITKLSRSNVYAIINAENRALEATITKWGISTTDPHACISYDDREEDTVSETNGYISDGRVKVVVPVISIMTGMVEGGK